MPRVQVEALQSSSVSATDKAGFTPTQIKTPGADHESFLRRTELSPTEAPHLQARTSALISKVEEKIIPENKEHAAVDEQNLEAGQGKGKEDSVATAAFMQNLKLSDDSTYNTSVSKELHSAKACLDRAETMLLVQRKVQCTPVEDHSSVRTLLQHAGKLLEQAENELSQKS